MRAQVRVAALAPFALAARLGRIDCDQRADRKAQPIRRFRSHHAGQFMAEHERAHFRPSGRAALEVRMDVAAANAHRLDAQQHVAGLGRGGRDIRHPNVPDIVENRRTHEHTCRWTASEYI